MMSNLTLGMDYWSLTLPRIIQGFALGFIFVPLSTLTLATIRRDKLVNATSAYNVLRNLGGSVGIALATTYLAQRSQFHQHNLVSHVTIWDPATQERLARWTSHFMAQGADSFTAQRRAVAMLYHDAVSAGPGAGLRGRLLAASPSSSRSCRSSCRSCGACTPSRSRPAGGRPPARCARCPRRWTEPRQSRLVTV